MNAIRLQNIVALHWLWVLPVMVGLYVFAGARRRAALAAFIDAGIIDRIKISVSPVRRRWKAVLVLLALAAIVVGMTRPGWNPSAKKVERRGRDVIFLLDVSKSMLAEDLAPSRLERAKLAIVDCVEKLDGDRVGLVVFAGSSQVKCPLTLDYGFFRLMLEDVDTESITKGGTLIGDALRKVLGTRPAIEEAAMERVRTPDGIFDDQIKEYKDVILITDGEDHDSFPVEAAEEAGERGVRLIAIGLGDENEGRRIPITDRAGRKTFMKHQGQEVWSRLDADTLRKMVNVTEGGRYLNVSTGTFDLGEIYTTLVASAAKKDLESMSVERYEERFQIFLVLALACLSLNFVLSDRSKQRA